MNKKKLAVIGASYLQLPLVLNDDGYVFKYDSSIRIKKGFFENIGSKWRLFG